MQNLFLNKETVLQAFTVKKIDNSKLLVVKVLTSDVSGHCHTPGKCLSTNHVGLKAILSVTTVEMRQNKFS